MAAYWPKLERAQALADKALVNGREAQADLKSASARLGDADSWVGRATKESEDFQKDKEKKDAPAPDEDKVRAATRNAQSAKSAQGTAKADVSSANSALDAAKKMAADARKMREDAAREAKDKLDEASDAGIKNRKWWEEVGDWVTDNWDTIVTVCKVVVAVLGIVAMIIGGPIALLVLAAALVVLADTLNKYRKGEASLWDVAFAALDCIPGMKGLTTLGGLAKGLKGGLAVARGGMKAMGTAVRGLAKSARGAIADSAKGTYSRLKSKIKGCGDPVDVATGQMFLAETDLVLPGVLPLSFTRRVSSGYRTGWWFGPTWSSTIDQRLEIDEQGVVFVTDDGMLLAYPHPEAPDTAVLPEVGPRWPLVRLESGGYRVEDPIGGHSRLFTAPADGLALLERIADRNGNTFDFDYCADSTPLAIRHSGGYQLKLSVHAGRVTALSLAAAADDGTDVIVKQYGYTDGNLTEVLNSSGIPLQFAYDERLRITSWTDTNDSRYSYSYDEKDRCTSQGGEAGHVTTTFCYDEIDHAWPGARITTLTTTKGATSRFAINNSCQVIAETDPLGGTVRTAYDANHHMVSWTDELGHTTYFANNALGQPIEVTRSDDSVVSYAYNTLNLPSVITQPNATTWLREYDERGNCTSVTNPAGATTHYAHAESGHLAAATNMLGHTTTVRCDQAGLPCEVTGPLGATTSWERDAFGRPVAFTDALGHTTRLTWTVEGRLTRRVAQDGTTESWSYDGEGNCTTHTDPMGAVSLFEYTHFDLLAARTGPDGMQYTFTHDSDLRLSQVTNPQGLTWTYEYDLAGRVMCETDFDDRALAYTHDSAGRLTSRTNSLGQTIRYRHDPLGRVIRKEAEGQVTTFHHGLSGQLDQATGPDTAFSLLRDRNGLVISEVLNGRQTNFSYDELGRRTRRTTPSGTVTTWAYDAAGNRSQLTASGRTIRFDHDQAGRELARHIGESASVANTFDELGRLTTQSVSAIDGRSIQHRSYTYRPDGLLSAVDDQLNGDRRFDLDAVGRVTAVHAHRWTEKYAYDEVGNQTDASWPSSHSSHDATGPRAYSGTRIIRAGSIRYEHDVLGRIILRQKMRLSRKPENWRYKWDAEDRLASVISPDGTLWRYQYDPLGRRTAKQRLAADGETVVEQVDFTWDGTTLCEQTTKSPTLPNHVTITWDHDGLRPITQTERISSVGAPQEEIDSRFFAIVSDLVGAPTELIDETGNIAWCTRTTLWGSTAWNTGAAAYTPLRFPGQYYDPETGLHYNYFRHYDPETARYLTPDPLGLTPDPNPNSYVYNPHTRSDHLGLAPDCRPRVYRAPHTNNRANEARGLDPANHPATGRHEGTAYLGDSPSVAAQYAGEAGFEPGFHEYIMKPEFLDEFPAANYRQLHENSRGVEEYEWVIPEGDIPRFNALVDDVQWYDSYGGFYEPGR